MGIVLCVCLHKCARVPAGKQLSPRGNSQPLSTAGRARLSNYRGRLCQKPRLSLSIDGMTGLHRPTHTDTHKRRHVPLSPLLLSWHTCLPALWANSTPIKGAELFFFFQKANPTPVSRLYTGNRRACAVLSVNAGVTVCGRQRVCF